MATSPADHNRQKIDERREILAPLKKKRAPGAGRPKIAVDMNRVERLCSWGCTHAEIADWLNISKRTLERLLEDEKKTYAVLNPKTKATETLTLRAIMERGYAHLRISLRRQQIKLLMEGNATMAVWLGKQLLGQTDRLRVQEAPPPPEAAVEVPVTLEELLRAYRKASQ